MKTGKSVASVGQGSAQASAGVGTLTRGATAPQREAARRYALHLVARGDKFRQLEPVLANAVLIIGLDDDGVSDIIGSFVHLAELDMEEDQPLQEFQMTAALADALACSQDVETAVEMRVLPHTASIADICDELVRACAQVSGHGAWAWLTWLSRRQRDHFSSSMPAEESQRRQRIGRKFVLMSTEQKMLAEAWAPQWAGQIDELLDAVADVLSAKSRGSERKASGAWPR